MLKVVNELRREIQDERGNGIVLTYNILIEDKIDENTNNTIKSYGLKVTKTDSYIKTEAEILDVTSDLSFAEDIFKTISNNYVTPITLYDVIEDMIIQKYSI